MSRSSFRWFAFRPSRHLPSTLFGGAVSPPPQDAVMFLTLLDFRSLLPYPFRMKLCPLIFIAALIGSVAARAGTADIPMGFVPPAWVVQEVRKTLSPQGRFVLLNATGAVRVIDSDDKIAAVSRLLARLEKAPSIVTLKIEVIHSGTKNVQTQIQPDAAIAGTELPYPHRFLPPKIVQNSSGGFIVTPSQPTDFRSRTVGASEGTAQVITQTVPTREIAKRLMVSSVPGTPVTTPLLAKVEDIAGLRAMALRLGAVSDQEPSWTSAATELVIQTEMAGPDLKATITPQIVLPSNSPQEPRRIPLQACAGSVTISRASPSPTGTLPQTNSEFYRLFMGLPAGASDDITALNLAADVRFVSTKPPE